MKGSDFIAAMIDFVLWAMVLCIVVAWLMIISVILDKANAHDIYNNVRSHKTGQLCCGGDPDTGDCEALELHQINIRPDKVIIYSERYHRYVDISLDKIEWQVVPGSDAPGHWCGSPRGKVSIAPINAENPDKDTWTYCAFLSFGGT